MNQIAFGLAGLLSGAVFGFALDHGKTNIPYGIAQQMGFANFNMMRMFLSACATSTVAVLIIDRLGWGERKPKPGLSLGFNKLWGMGANIVGGMLLGAGMRYTGSCPGTVFAQIGAGIPGVQYVVAGGILGTILFAYTQEHMFLKKDGYHKKKHSDMAHHLNIPYPIAAVGFALACAGAIWACNELFPWKEQLEAVLVHVAPDQWDPVYSGMMIGMLQFPAILLSNDGLGQSSGWVLVSSYFAELFHSKPPAYLTDTRVGKKAVFQVLISSGIILGAAVSQYVSSYPDLTVQASTPEPPARLFFGAIMLLFGARLAGGCTSGIGLSGMANLSLSSLVGVAGMFAGGGLAAAIDHAVGYN